MGITYVNAEVSGPAGSLPLEFLVDTGAMFSLLPEKVWRTVGLEPQRVAAFALADGRRIERKMSECRFSLPQGDCTTPVILGEAGDKPLLGVITLEILGLTFNPMTRELKQVELHLLAIA